MHVGSKIVEPEQSVLPIITRPNVHAPLVLLVTQISTVFLVSDQIIFMHACLLARLLVQPVNLHLNAFMFQYLLQALNPLPQDVLEMMIVQITMHASIIGALILVPMTKPVPN